MHYTQIWGWWICVNSANCIKPQGMCIHCACINWSHWCLWYKQCFENENIVPFPNPLFPEEYEEKQSFVCRILLPIVFAVCHGIGMHDLKRGPLVRWFCAGVVPQFGLVHWPWQNIIDEPVSTYICKACLKIAWDPFQAKAHLNTWFHSTRAIIKYF